MSFICIILLKNVKKSVSKSSIIFIFSIRLDDKWTVNINVFFCFNLESVRKSTMQMGHLVKFHFVHPQGLVFITYYQRRRNKHYLTIIIYMYITYNDYFGH